MRQRSALGLKYVEITKGTEAKGYEDGSTIALGQATPEPVEFEHLLGEAEPFLLRSGPQHGEDRAQLLY